MTCEGLRTERDTESEGERFADVRRCIDTEDLPRGEASASDQNRLGWQTRVVMPGLLVRNRGRVGRSALHRGTIIGFDRETPELSVPVDNSIYNAETSVAAQALELLLLP